MLSVPEQHVIATARRVGQHEWRRAIRGQMPTTTFAVAQALAAYTNKDGSRAFPGNERLAADLCCTTKTIQRALKWLRENHWLQLDQGVTHAGTSRKLAQEWSLTVPDRWTSGTGPVDTGVHPPDPSSNHSSSLTLAQPPVEPMREQLDPKSEQFDAWAALEWIEERCDGFTDYEGSTADGMLSAGVHPRAIVNRIEADRRHAA